MANTTTNLENIWTKIAAVTRDEVRLAVLQDEVEILKSRLQYRCSWWCASLLVVLKIE